MDISIFPLKNFPIINPGDALPEIIVRELKKIDLKNQDIVVIAHTIVSKAENKVYYLDEITPSPLAIHIGTIQDKDPRRIEVILRESKEIVRMNDRVLITASLHGFVCANSGIDKSNTAGNTVISLPTDPDLSAREIKKAIKEFLGFDVAVIITDTFGRPLRVGTVNFAIGVAGINPLEDIRGSVDLFGFELKSTIIARADEVAAAAGIVMGQANEGTPVIIVRGVKYSIAEASAKDLIRNQETDVFR
ncbi:MAG: coenzyme F420-0:L-glutamate ligase [Candidatus Heimdallarchaeota archaeon]|nr:coenzyme F420-0:L-glutamate ligase [Candidatus Heimdallarchaeota archaeon]